MHHIFIYYFISYLPESSLEDWICNTDDSEEEEVEDVDISKSTTDTTITTTKTESSTDDKKTTVVTENVSVVKSCHYTTGSSPLPQRTGSTGGTNTNNKTQKQINEISEIVFTSETIQEMKSSSLQKGSPNDMDGINNNTKNVTVKQQQADENRNVKKVSGVTMRPTTFSDENEQLSDRTKKRMLRISESDTPEIDQVLKVMVCQEASTVTIKQLATTPE